MDKNAVSETIFNIVQSYRQAIRAELQANDLGLNGMHVRCLSFIRHRNQCTANDIVQQFSRDKAQVARIVKDMISKGWIIKTPNPNDKRSQQLFLTEQGVSLSDKIELAQYSIQNKMLENISEEELKTFVAVADKLSDNLQ
ncbi:transcriptional regulator [Vibrio sp. UCD-FRSSP16_10]|uniref:MarR family winged helix-turn-helix transcriptional regulator n=1 Tax=unclassified Vibrio TaxID=2614977 RepID=UPI0007FF32D4|nr:MULTISPECIES: MarR family winged helix-turn-helix transcriptional regulator [unclassified Vibrio]OBT15555.1 transcriptional regulator [Vibrio sp. UCD-FRSSP16_30]OBT20628.1 transcriptional regulator [Vibrio sp. UCD-FRSSP16_10]